MTVAFVEIDGIRLPRAVVTFPIALRTPPGFDPADPDAWPAADGRLEYVEGRLLYMPPCGDSQSDAAVGVVLQLGQWATVRTQFVPGGNETGMLLGGDARGADGAVWRAADLGKRTGRFRRVPPVLAVEVAGQDEGEAELREKADWYLGHGVEVVWLVLPDTREVVVLTAGIDERYRSGDRLPEHQSLPELTPAVDDLFVLMDRTAPAMR